VHRLEESGSVVPSSISHTTKRMDSARAGEGTIARRRSRLSITAGRYVYKWSALNFKPDPDGLSTLKPIDKLGRDYWMGYILHLARQNIRGCPLVIERMSSWSSFANSFNGPHWTLLRSNLFQASVDAIDTLLWLVDTEKEKPPLAVATIAEPLSLPASAEERAQAGPSDTVSAVARGNEPEERPLMKPPVLRAIPLGPLVNDPGWLREFRSGLVELLATTKAVTRHASLPGYPLWTGAMNLRLQVMNMSNLILKVGEDHEERFRVGPVCASYDPRIFAACQWAAGWIGDSRLDTLPVEGVDLPLGDFSWLPSKSSIDALQEIISLLDQGMSRGQVTPASGADVPPQTPKLASPPGPDAATHGAALGPPVILSGPDEDVTVCGKRKGPLPPAQYRVVKALVEAKASVLS